ncbi:MAG: TadE family protein [Litoreibacter sp.]
MSNRFSLKCLTREEGNSTIEFVIIFPLLMALFLSVIEMGIMMTRYMMFERALDVSMRTVRLDAESNYTRDSIRDTICEETLIARHCQSTLVLEMVRLDADDQSWSFPTNSAVCANRADEDAVPATNFVPGQSNDTMYVRACISVTPMFPWAGLGASIVKDSSGDYSMVALSAFAVEPI